MLKLRTRQPSDARQGIDLPSVEKLGTTPCCKMMPGQHRDQREVRLPRRAEPLSHAASLHPRHARRMPAFP